MHIKSILAAAAIALAATVGSAYAADQFATLDGVTAQPMNTAEMDQVRGTVIVLGDIVPSAADFGRGFLAIATDGHGPDVTVPDDFLP